MTRGTLWQWWACGLTGALVAFASGRVAAEPYDTRIVIESDQDLYELEASGEITAEQRDRLLELYERPLDLNRATRDELYELPNVTYAFADALIAERRRRKGFRSLSEVAELVGPDLWEQIRPFVTVGPPPGAAPPRLRVHGSVDTGVLANPGGSDGPSAWVRARARVPRWQARAGWVGLLRQQLSPLRYVSADVAQARLPYFVGGSPHTRFDPIAKGYAAKHLGLGGGRYLAGIAGSYVVGFAERLTFDVTNRLRPDGWYPDDILYYDYQRADVRPHRGLFGAAVTLGGVPLGRGVQFAMTAFGSWWRYDVFQEDLNVFDPEDFDADGDFYETARVYTSVDAAEPGPERCHAEGRCILDETFPNAWSEAVFGGHIALDVGEHLHVGTTGWWGRTNILAGDERALFAPSARWPMRRQMWALGVDVAGHWAHFDAFAEVTRMDNGGWGAVLRTVASAGRLTLEASGRYFDARFDNPHARATAQADEFFGNRARDEAGGRLRAVYAPVRWLRVQAIGDAWVRLVSDIANLQVIGRTDVLPWKWLRYSTWLRYTDKDLSRGGRAQDYDAAIEYDQVDQVDLVAARDFGALQVASAGAGAKIDWGHRLTLSALPRTRVVADFQWTWKDVRVASVPAFDHSFEKTWRASLRVAVRPVRALSLAARFRALDEDVAHDDRGDKLWEIYGQVGVVPWPWLAVLARYDFRKYTDSTPPDPAEVHLVRAYIKVRW